MHLEPHLAPRAANHPPLTPVEFLIKTTEVHGHKAAVAWGEVTWSYRAFARMVGRFARFLQANGIRQGDVVSIMAANRPEMLAAHFAVPVIGAVLNTINTRLGAATVGYILGHCQSRLLLTDRPCRLVALEAASNEVRCCVLSRRQGEEIEDDAIDLLTDDGVEADFDLAAIADEWQPLCINYTSGTTGRPKGVVYTHRGAYLNALGNVLALGLTEQDRKSV